MTDTKVKDLNCKTCGHYMLYKMINSGKPFCYSGDIPCQRCSRFAALNDEHALAQRQKGE